MVARTAENNSPCSFSFVKPISNEFIIPIKKMLKKRITFDYSYINKVNYILKENKITYKEFDKDVIYEFTYEEGNYPKELDNYIK